jgi:arylsulfatase A-like enzyme
MRALASLLFLTYLTGAFFFLRVHSPNRPHVILISVDTLAAENMSLYGYRHRTTPAIEKFAGQTVVFDNAFSHAAYTLASHYSIFTGTYPDTHGVGLCEGFENDTILAPDIRTLPEYLRAAGYKTFWVGQLEDPQLDLQRGLGRGIDVKIFADIGKLSMPEDRKNIEAILQSAAKQPSFLFFHSYFVHDPYSPAPRYARSFGPRTSRESSQRADYDGGVRTFDDEFAVFLEMLKHAGLYDNAIIVFTSGHGEAFGGHGHFYHAMPYREEIHIPLMVRFPGVVSRRVEAPAYSIDIVPTILELLDLKVSARVEGQSLVPLFSGHSVQRPGYAHALGCRSKAISDAKWKLISFGNGERQLFHVTDKLEVNDVSGENPHEVMKLQAASAAFELDRLKITDGIRTDGPNHQGSLARRQQE